MGDFAGGKMSDVFLNLLLIMRVGGEKLSSFRFFVVEKVMMRVRRMCWKRFMARNKMTLWICRRRIENSISVCFR
ncbi:hypothetical protein, partial [Staphylococcus epidermidis]|uniref:hypothetical protein n=1 Tax=Staphylococcus epidermidis TaxID=1282 RepID=UPI001C92BD4C